MRCDSACDPKVADKTNPGRETFPTGKAEVGRCCAVVGCWCLGPGVLHVSALLCCVSPFDDEMAPGGSVRGECLIRLSADVKYFRETFRLSLNSSLCPPTALLP